MATFIFDIVFATFNDIYVLFELILFYHLLLWLASVYRWEERWISGSLTVQIIVAEERHKHVCQLALHCNVWKKLSIIFSPVYMDE